MREDGGNAEEVQYCVVLEEGPDKGLKHYVWDSKEKVKNIMRVLDKNYQSILKKEGIISFTDPDWKISFTKRNEEILLGSLEIRVDDKNSGIDLFNTLSED